MNEVSVAIARWFEQKRRTDRASAAVLAFLALATGLSLFLLTALVFYTFLSVFFGAFRHSTSWPAFVALGLTVTIFLYSLQGRHDEFDLRLDPLGYWILKDIFSISPRLILEGLRQIRRFGQLGELNLIACTSALAYLARQNSAIPWHDLTEHCQQLPSSRLRDQLSLLDGVLFLGDDGARVTLMEPFRLRLRWMLGPEPARPKPAPPPRPVPLNEPENLTPYEILGLTPSASMAEIKKAYRKRVKECHPDLFAGMDQQSKAFAERWTRALNAAYATLNPRPGPATPNRARRR